MGCDIAKFINFVIYPMIWICLRTQKLAPFPTNANIRFLELPSETVGNVDWGGEGGGKERLENNVE